MSDPALLEAGIPEVTSEPLTSEFSRNQPVAEAISRGIQRFYQVKNPTIGVLQAEMFREIAELKKDPRVAKEDLLTEVQLEVILDLVFNFIRLEKSTLKKKEGETISLEAKFASARIQQELVHSVIYAASSYSSPEYTQTIYNIVRSTAVTIARVERNETTELKKLWTGVRNQLAVTKALLVNGYRVFIPDYTQDYSSINFDNQDSVNTADNEVLQLDVKRGIDIIAVSPLGKIILIDAKGKRASEIEAAKEEARRHNSSEIDLHNPLHPSLRRCFESVARKCGLPLPSIVFKGPIFARTDGSSFVPTQFPKELHQTHEARQTELENLGKLQPQIEADIIAQVTELGASSAIRKWTSQ